MRISDVMTGEVATAEASESSAVGLGRMETEHVHHLVVMSGGQLVGVVSRHDLATKPGRTPLSEAMTPAPVVVTPDQHVDKAANLLRGHGIGCLPVVDDGKLVGIVTVSDLLELIGRGRGKTDRTSVNLNGRRSNNRRQPAGR